MLEISYNFVNVFTNSVSLDPATTILDFKEYLENEYFVPPQQLFVKYGNRLMRNDTILENFITLGIC